MKIGSASERKRNFLSFLQEISNVIFIVNSFHSLIQLEPAATAFSPPRRRTSAHSPAPGARNSPPKHKRSASPMRASPPDKGSLSADQVIETFLFWN